MTNKRKIAALVLIILTSLSIFIFVSSRFININDESLPVTEEVESENEDSLNEDNLSEENKETLQQVDSTDVDSNELTVSKSNTNKASVSVTTPEVEDNSEIETEKPGNVTVVMPAPSVTFSDKNSVINNEWLKTIPTIIEFDTKDHSNTGIKEVSYCTVSSFDTADTNLTCTPTIIALNTPFEVSFDAEAYNHAICVKVTDNKGRTTTSCSSKTMNFGIDATAPTITIDNPNETIIQGSMVDYDEMHGVSAEDIEFSGLKSLTYSGEVNPNVVDNYTITYTALDYAGNTSTKIKTVIVESNQITYTLSDNASTSNEWNKTSVKIWLEELEDDAIAKYCTSTDADCTPTTALAKKEEIELVENSATNKICIEISKANKITKTICTSYKIDQVPPVITDNNPNPSNIAVLATDEINLLEDISATDALSNIKTFIPSGESVELINGNYYLVPTKIGNYTVLYTATDNAENTVTHQRIYSVDSLVPTFTLSANPDFNWNGWANSDIAVTINTSETDYTKKTCLTTGASCTPTTDNGLKITNESTSSRMCVVVINKYGKESSLVCTDAYKLDKTPPTASGVSYWGTMSSKTVVTLAACPAEYQESVGLELTNGECRSIEPVGVAPDSNPIYNYTEKIPASTDTVPTGWYVSDVSVGGKNVADSLSGYSGVTTNQPKNMVTKDGANIEIKLYMTDKAGNSSYLTEYIKRDTVAPVITEGVNKEGSVFSADEEVLISTFYGELSDATSGIKELNITGDVVLKDDIYYLDTTTTGSKSITLELVDNAEHKKTLTINVTVE